MSGKWIAFWIWTVVVVGCVVLGGIAVTKDKVYTGTDIKFETGRTLQIDAETVTFEAASSGFFVLRKESGETIIGVPTQPPLGWANSKYFVAGPQEIPGGEWLFPNGNATVKISSDKAVTVRAIEPDPFGIWFGLSLIAVIIWGMFILIFAIN